MNLTERIYIAVYVVLTALVCLRHDRVEHWIGYDVAWNLGAIAVIVLLAHKQSDSRAWAFVHDCLPGFLFLTVFSEVSYLSLVLRTGWQNQYVIAFESRFFPVPPLEWMHLHAKEWLIEFLEFSYFAFYFFYPVAGALFWAWRERPPFAGAFRRLTDALSVGYVICYATYLLFPTRSPANLVGVQQIGSAHGGPFQHVVRAIQHQAGVHGNAFPSAHIMLAFVVLVFAYRYLPRVAPWLLFPVLLMCVGAVYDGYHYSSDVVAGAIIGIAVALAFLPKSTGPQMRTPA